MDNIFIGFHFSDLNSANNFQLMIKKLNDQIVYMMLDSESMKVKELRKDRKKKFYENCEILKKNFGAENKYSRDYCEDFMEIRKPIFYILLNFITYNRETKEFEVGNVPKEFRNLFKNMGIKKHMLKKADTTLNFFKYFIESLDKMETINQRKVSHMSNDEEEEDIDKNNENNSMTSDTSSNYTDNSSVINNGNKSNLSDFVIGNNKGNFNENKNNMNVNKINTQNDAPNKPASKIPPVPAAFKTNIPPVPKIVNPPLLKIKDNDSNINQVFFIFLSNQQNTL